VSPSFLPADTKKEHLYLTEQCVVGLYFVLLKTITGLDDPKNSCHVTLDGFNSDVELVNALIGSKLVLIP